MKMTRVLSGSAVHFHIFHDTTQIAQALHKVGKAISRPVLDVRVIIWGKISGVILESAYGLR